MALKNQFGISMANRTSTTHLELPTLSRWQRAFNVGAWPQHLLWASTGINDANVFDIHYGGHADQMQAREKVRNTIGKFCSADFEWV